jgi:hypothetical protein
MKASEKEKKRKQKEKRNQLLPGPISTACSPTNLNPVPISAVGSAVAARPFCHRHAGPLVSKPLPCAQTHVSLFVSPLRQEHLPHRNRRSDFSAVRFAGIFRSFRISPALPYSSPGQSMRGLALYHCVWAHALESPLSQLSSRAQQTPPDSPLSVAADRGFRNRMLTLHNYKTNPRDPLSLPPSISTGPQWELGTGHRARCGESRYRRNQGGCRRSGQDLGQKALQCRIEDVRASTRQNQQWGQVDFLAVVSASPLDHATPWAAPYSPLSLVSTLPTMFVMSSMLRCESRIDVLRALALDCAAPAMAPPWAVPAPPSLAGGGGRHDDRWILHRRRGLD